MNTARLVKRGETLLVETSWPHNATPTETMVRWQVTRIVRSPYGGGFPEDGDPLTDSRSLNGWANYHGKNYSVHFPSTAEAVETEERAVVCPKVRKGTETRWYCGAWEKLTRGGWVRL